MKRFFVIAIAMFCALILLECVARYIIAYPTFGLEYKVHYRNGGDYWTNAWKPYSRYWNVEGGNKVFQRNNLGLPGIDINPEYPNRVMLLGSSYLEAYQIHPTKIASSVFAELLKKNRPDYQVYNLGCSGHDPYDSYMRLLYYEKIYKPQFVILVINSDNADWFNRHPKPLDFHPDASFGKIKQGKLSQLQTRLRNSSALIALLSKGMNSDNKSGDNEQETEASNPQSKELKKSVVTIDLQQVIWNLQNRYSNFMVVSIVNDSDFNKTLAGYCNDNGISFNTRPIVTRQNMINSTGHMNETGNRKLGELLFESFMTFF